MMKMHLLYYRRLHGTAWSPLLSENNYSIGTTGVVAIDQTAGDLETIRLETADSMELDSADQLKWVEVEPALH